MVKKIDRTGEENVNNFGSKMIISKYNNNRDMDVYFPAYNWTAKNITYGNFKKGNIKCPYERRVHGKICYKDAMMTTLKKRAYIPRMRSVY